MQKITIETGRYNEKRYGKPWIARVDFGASTRGNFLFGGWLGGEGEEGELSVCVEEGDIVARGQKDFRNPRNSAPTFYFVGVGCELVECKSKMEAVRAQRAHREAASADAEQLA